MEMEEQDDFPMYEEREPEEIIPDFIEKKELSGAAKGTLLHRFLQHFDYKSSLHLEQIKEQMDRRFSRDILQYRKHKMSDLDKIDGLSEVHSDRGWYGPTKGESCTRTAICLWNQSI